MSKNEDKDQIVKSKSIEREKKKNVDVKKTGKDKNETTVISSKKSSVVSDNNGGKGTSSIVKKTGDTTSKKVKSIKSNDISDVETNKKKKSKNVLTKTQDINSSNTIKDNTTTEKNKTDNKNATNLTTESDNVGVKVDYKDYSINSKQLNFSNEENNFHHTLCSKMYREVIVKNLQKELNIKNVMEVPKLVKVCVNQGVGSISGDKKQFEIMRNGLSNICGQKAINCKSKKAISNFKLKEGANIGCMVTLRRKKMYEFLDRLVNIALPRIRDFRGLSTDSFDNYGVYNLGLKEQIIFPEISIDKNIKIIGMNISIITTSHNKDWNLALLKALGFPFKKK